MTLRLLWAAVVGLAIGSSTLASAQGSDLDGDGVGDAADNCSMLFNPDQRDSNADGFGNACDMDLNNDGVVNVADLGILRGVFLTNDDDADSNGDGVVNVVDLGVFRSQFFAPPGPGALELVYTQRVVRSETDNNMDGIVDYVANFTFQPDGQVSTTSTASVNFDPASPPFILGTTIDIAYLPDGQPSGGTIEIRFANSTSNYAQNIVYANGEVVHIDTIRIDDATMDYQRAVAVRDDGVLIGRDNYFGNEPDSLDLIEEERREFNEQGRAIQRTQTAIHPNGRDTVTVYDIAVDGTVMSRELTETTMSGSVTRFETVVLGHSAGQLSQKAFFRDGSNEPLSIETWLYDEDGRVSQINSDSDGDGFVDAQTTYFWEEGLCRRSNSVFDLVGEKPDGRMDSGLTTFAYCHP